MMRAGKLAHRRNSRHPGKECRHNEADRAKVPTAHEFSIALTPPPIEPTQAVELCNVIHSAPLLLFAQIPQQALRAIEEYAGGMRCK